MINKLIRKLSSMKDGSEVYVREELSWFFMNGIAIEEFSDRTGISIKSLSAYLTQEPINRTDLQSILNAYGQGLGRLKLITKLSGKHERIDNN